MKKRKIRAFDPSPPPEFSWDDWSMNWWKIKYKARRWSYGKPIPIWYLWLSLTIFILYILF